MKKLFLLSICLLVSTSAALAQAKFSGQYMGIASPVVWSTNASERGLVDLYFHPTGYAFAQFRDYKFNLLTEAQGSINSSGRFSLFLDTGFIIKGVVSGGVARGSVTGPLYRSKYTFSLPRRFKLAFDPANPPVF